MTRVVPEGIAGRCHLRISSWDVGSEGTGKVFKEQQRRCRKHRKSLLERRTFTSRKECAIEDRMRKGGE